SDGNIGEALALARRALAADASPEARSLAASCLASPLIHPGLGDLRDLLVPALSEAWVRPWELAQVAAVFLARNDAIRDAMTRAPNGGQMFPSGEGFVSAAPVVNLAEDRLLRLLLESTPVCDVGLERFATALRFSMLTAARSAANGEVAEPVLCLYSALARQ